MPNKTECQIRQIPNLSQVDAPLRMLLKSDAEFTWSHEQRRSFEELKHLCSTPPVLTYFDVNQPAEIHCDASKDGLGAVLIQNGRPVAYTSRSLSDAESRYAQIEKEMLSILHASILEDNTATDMTDRESPPQSPETCPEAASSSEKNQTRPNLASQAKPGSEGTTYITRAGRKVKFPKWKYLDREG